MNLGCGTPTCDLFGIRKKSLKQASRYWLGHYLSVSLQAAGESDPKRSIMPLVVGGMRAAVTTYPFGPMGGRYPYIRIDRSNRFTSRNL